jgi:diguanylate cyclase (GGDEF)-like protein
MRKLRAIVRTHFSRWREASPLLLASGMTLLCLPMILVLVWSGAEHWQDRRVELATQRQSIVIESQLNDAESDLQTVFTQARNLGGWLADEGHVLDAIRSPAKVAEANRFLKKLSGSFNVDLVYIMNATGLCVASSNAGTVNSPIGRDFSDRMHFRMAMSGMPGYQFAMGRMSKVPGFYFSMPIFDHGKVVGTVAIKLNQSRLQHLARIGDTLVSDNYGIVVLTDEPRFMFNAMPGETTIDRLTPEQVHSRYARDDFPPLPLQSAGVSEYPGIMLFDDMPVLMGSRVMTDPGLIIHVMMDFDMLRDARWQKNTVFLVGAIGVSGLIWSLWVGLFYFLRARSDRQRLETANTRLSELNNELHEQATHDFLTGCLNRRAFTPLLRAELARVHRYGGELSLCVLDIDHFKRVNDTRGHEVGDVTLKFLVDALNQQMRRADVLARYGGEEFALLMPNTSAKEAVMVIDRMRQSISNQLVPGQTPPLKITFSAGVAGWHSGLDERTFVASADEALYEAKGAGRNRVMLGKG